MASMVGTASISHLLRNGSKNEFLGTSIYGLEWVDKKKKKKAGVVRAVMAPPPHQRSPASTGSVKHAMTTTEKILARAAEKSELSPGENVWVNVDNLMTHDVGGPGTIGIFKREFGSQAKIGAAQVGILSTVTTSNIFKVHCKQAFEFLGSGNSLTMASMVGTASISHLLRNGSKSKCFGTSIKDVSSSNPSAWVEKKKKKKAGVVRAVMAPPQPHQRSPASTGSVKHAMTMTEKILARAAEKSKLSPGENVWVNVDNLMTHDVCGPGTIGIFKREFGSQAKVWDREKIVLIPDHYIFTDDERANRNVDILRDFAQEQNIKYFYDIKDRSDFKANPDYKGVCHIALAQEGHCRPGEVLFGTDSHTCNAGAFGQFATGIGNTDAGFIMGTGKLLVKVPPSLRFVMDGEMPHYLLSKDLILQIIGEITVSGGTYRAMEFTGSTVERLTMEDRMTLCNMVVEAGGKNGVVAADQTTFDYLKGKTSASFEALYSDEAASFLCEYRFDVSKLEPLVAKPHSPDNRALARECRHVKIDRVYIGSCTGGKTEDFMAAAKLLSSSGQKVKVPTFLVPATQKVWIDLYTLVVPGANGKTCAQIFEEAGCDTPASPNCGACLGGPRDTYARMNEPQVCVSTTNRNFHGRMGHKEGQIYLASPYTAAASALTGYVTDPRDFL